MDYLFYCTLIIPAILGGFLLYQGHNGKETLLDAINDKKSLWDGIIVALYAGVAATMFCTLIELSCYVGKFLIISVVAWIVLFICLWKFFGYFYSPKKGA